MTQQLGRDKTPHIIQVQAEVAEIKRTITELYDKLVISEPVVTTVVPEEEVENIQSILNLVEETQERKKRKHQSSIEKEAMKKDKVDSLQSDSTSR